jgi:hypothetical protein
VIVIADVVSKFKWYITISIINLFIMLSYNITRSIYNNSLDILSLLGGFGTSFIPGVSSVQVVLTGINSVPTEVIALITLFTSILSGFQIVLISAIIANYVPTVNV